MSEVAKINSPFTPERVGILTQDWRRQLAVYENPDELIDLADRVEFIRAAAAKAKHSRDTLNQIGAVLWEVVRKAGSASAQFEPTSGRRHPNLTSCKVMPSAKDLGYHTAQQRQRWEICAALPDISVEHIKDKILTSSEGVLTLSALISAGKQFLREKEADDRTLLEDSCTTEDLQALVAANKKFGVIYADPPWEFKVYSGKGKSRSADRHYKADEVTGERVMTIEQVMALPIKELAADDCALFLWSVWPELPGALRVIEAWGFTYKTCGLLWVKQNESGVGLHWGMGYWTRANSEPCLFATRGSPKRVAKDVHQIIMSPVGEHSRKPEEANARIERLIAGPYLEMFARRPMTGWTVWGNQITKGLFNQSIPEIVKSE